MDFSSLSDDQLLQLLKAAMKEAIARGGAIKMAAENEAISAKQRAEIEFRVIAEFQAKQKAQEEERIAKETEERLRKEAEKKQTEQVFSNWAVKFAAIEAIKRWGYPGEDFSFTVWSRGADRRVYFNGVNKIAENFADGSRQAKGEWSWCLYLTGNASNPPDSLAGTGVACWFDNKKEPLQNLLKAIAASWKGDTKFANSPMTVDPSPKHLDIYLKAIGVEDEQLS